MASQSQISAYLSISTSHLKELIDRGEIEKKDTGRYDFDECRIQYINYLKGKNKKAQDIDLQAERARLAKEQADAKEMENAIERGDLVYIEKVAKEFETQFLKAKTKLLAMPSKIAAEVHASANVKEAKELIELNMQDALSELVGYGRQTTD